MGERLELRDGGFGREIKGLGVASLLWPELEWELKVARIFLVVVGGDEVDIHGSSGELCGR